MAIREPQRSTDQKSTEERISETSSVILPVADSSGSSRLGDASPQQYYSRYLRDSQTVEIRRETNTVMAPYFRKSMNVIL